MYVKFVSFIFLVCCFANNSHPIILIHGFLGWGRDEMADYYYWGGLMDYEQELIKQGYEVYSVSVGPVSSNRDRAIEAFYQIKGGQVDYGLEVSKTLGIIQKPKNKYYSGLYPLWDNKHPIHIIAHSLGGQTARMLETLLKTQYINENSPLLSNKYNGWIKSITAVSVPHNGTTLVPIMLDIFPFLLNLAPWVGSINNQSINNLYNFDLEHWGLYKKQNESIDEFFIRISLSNIINTKNLCSWDLSLEGATEFNKIYVEDENVYYFSFITSATTIDRQTNMHYPNNNMSFRLWPTSILMGIYDNAPNNSWYENDGIVNTISMSHPFESPNSKYKNNKPRKGIWQTIDIINVDHQAIIGHGVNKQDNQNMFALYNKHCKLLYTLK